MRKLIIFAALAAGLYGCNGDNPSRPKANQAPETHLFLVIGDSLGHPYSDTLNPDGDSLAIDSGYVSRQVLHWYGDDRDGEIIGYQWAWDDTSSDTAWTFTALTVDTFYVKIRTQFDYFTFYVRAIDSDSMVDPTPAKMTFPIVNSPPWIKFPVAFTNDFDTAYFVSFNYFTFGWSGGDPDGDETVAGYLYYLADSSVHTEDSASFNWQHLDSLTFSRTFTDLQPGFYRFFIQSFDIAGARSSILAYPSDDTTSHRPKGVWEVKEARGNILYIDDNRYDFTPNTEHIFTDILDSLYLDLYSELNIERRSFFYPQDIDSTLKIFDIVIWSAAENRHFGEAASGITSFINDGGHLFTNFTYDSRDTVIYPFMPIDSVYAVDLFRPQFFVTPANPDSTVYPDSLLVNLTSALQHTFAFAPGVARGIAGNTYDVLYTTLGDTVAIRFPSVNESPEAKVILFSFTVFDCNRYGYFTQMFANILQREFSDGK